MNLKGFNTWSAVLQHVNEGEAVYYKAPFDAGGPRVVRVAKVFKNKKIRIDPMSNDADQFTADVDHLDRFFHAPLSVRYVSGRGWCGGDDRTLYAFTCKLTGRVTVSDVWRFGGGENCDVRVATRVEAADQGWPEGWTVA